MIPFGFGPGQAEMAALGWALVHFIWQGALLALLLAAALAATKRSPTNIRYLLACLTLGLMALAPVLTYRAGFRPRTETVAAIRPAFEKRLTEWESIPASARVAPTPAPVVAERFLPTLAMAWLGGVLVCFVRLLGSCFWLERVRRQASVSRELADLVARLSRRMGIRQTVRVLETSDVQSPCVLGWLRVVILSPPASAMGLSLGQLEALFAHELEHVRRYDYLANLLQSIAETLLFYHPAVWWVSARIREERENCCDDAAIRAIGDRLFYARALAALVQNRRRAQWAPASNGGDLMNRMYRILGLPPIRRGGGALWLAVGVAAAVLGIGLVAAEVGATAEDPSRDEAAQPVPGSVASAGQDPFDNNDKVVEKVFSRIAENDDGAGKFNTETLKAESRQLRERAQSERRRDQRERDRLVGKRRLALRLDRSSKRTPAQGPGSSEIRKAIAEALAEVRAMRPEIDSVVKEALAMAREGVASIKDPKDRLEAEMELRKALAEAKPEVEKGLAEAIREIAKVGPEIEKALAEAIKENPDQAPRIADVLKSSLAVLPSLKPIIRDSVREALKGVQAQMPEIKRAIEQAVAEANNEKEKGDKGKTKDKTETPEPPQAPNR